MNIKKMKIDGYRIRIVYKDLGQEKYLKKVYLKQIEDSLLVQNVELVEKPEDKILVIDDLATATLVRRQLEDIVMDGDSVELEPIYNFD
jgi:hypothetical protein